MWGRGIRKIQEYLALYISQNHITKDIAGATVRALEGVGWGLKVNLSIS